MKFGTVLRKLIEEHGITQKSLAAKLNLAPSTLGSYVQNTREPDFELLKKIASYFQVTTDYLLDYRSDAGKSAQEDELLQVFRLLTPKQQAIYLEQGKAFIRLGEQDKQDVNPPPPKTSLKLDEFQKL